ncbi:MAG TPA: chemotaxis protein CheW [Burkholderiaceae bacterium]|nr:chemotaxis protein CheW [Burkholderiaceae bacterium]
MGDMTNEGANLQSGGFDLTQFYQVFFEEAGENLTSMEQLLLELDVDNADDEELNAIFRCAHSIKGGAATFGFADVAELTHQMETLLDKLRRHELGLNTSMVDTLLTSGDMLRAQLARHQGASTEVVDTTQLLADIAAPLSGQPVVAAARANLAPEAAPAAAAAAAPVAAPAPGAPVQRTLEVVVGPLSNPAQADDLLELFKEVVDLGTMSPMDEGKADESGKRRFKVVTKSNDADLIDLFSFHVSREQIQIIDSTHAPASAPSGGTGIEGFGLFSDVPEQAASSAAAKDPGYGFFVDPTTLPGKSESKPAAPAAAKPAVKAEPKAPAPAAAADSTIRVSVEKVDQLINLVGELVITQAMLAQNARGLDPVVHQQMIAGLNDLERNTRDLQEAVMSVRMIPMSFVFSRFPRMVRDLTAKLGKQVELHTVGEATELDKGLIEKITDPLTHLVRNSVDHGIEKPEDRIAKGKPAQGTVTLSAQHQGGSIVIEVKDDGRGLNREKILAKAREKGIPVADEMTDQEVWQLIFAPGFSTADAVTDVSGRGVGMDVVKKNITSLGGTVELDSADGLGTRVSVRLPLTLAIMDGMSVGVGDEVYILPLGSVVESFQVDDKQVRTIGGSERVVEVRNEYMPVVALEELFNVPRFDWDSNGGIMVIVESEGGRVALLVDQLIGQHQIVVKNLEANYRKINHVSGATIMGDGRVALILDTISLVRRSRH